jgi:hypothetical protein
MISGSRQYPEQEIPESSAKFRNEIQESSGLLLFPHQSFGVPNRQIDVGSPWGFIGERTLISCRRTGDTSALGTNID